MYNPSVTAMPPYQASPLGEVPRRGGGVKLYDFWHGLNEELGILMN